MGKAVPWFGKRSDRSSAGAGIHGLPADVQKAAAGFPEMQAQSKQSKGS